MLFGGEFSALLEAAKNAENINLQIEGAVGYYFVEIIASGHKKAVVKILKLDIKEMMRGLCLK